jgi:hypothetical protein
MHIWDAKLCRTQFWYTEETAAVVAQEAIQLADGGAIACVACPSLFRHIRKHHPDVSAHLFEIDTRFEVQSITIDDYVPSDYHSDNCAFRLCHAPSLQIQADANAYLVGPNGAE